MRTTNLDESSPHVADPHAEVETMYIAEYLKSKGYAIEELARLPEEEARVLLEEASLHASLRLAELETGAALVSALRLDDSLTTNPIVEQTSIKQQSASER